MRRWLIIGLLFFSAFCFSCSNKSNGSGGGGGDDGNPINNPGSDIKVSSPKKIDSHDNAKNSDVAVAAISLAVDPTGRWSVAYYKQSDQNPGQCQAQSTGGGSTQLSLTSIYYSTFNDTVDNLVIEEVTSDDAHKLKATSLPGISLVFNKANLPLIAYLGGTEPQQCCGGGDLMQASRNTTWSIRTISSNSNDAPSELPFPITSGEPNCPNMQSLCDTGDTVGLWPSQAVAPTSGTVGIVFKDLHLCYALTDVDNTDVNIASINTSNNISYEWIDLGRGAGNYGKLVYDKDDVPAAVFYNGKWGGGMINFSRRETATGHWPWNYCTLDTDCGVSNICIYNRCATVIQKDLAGLPEGSLSLTVDTNNHYLLAYFDSDTKHLMFAYSENGTKWQSAPIDSGSSTGKFPNILINPITNKPVIVYYNCSADQNVSNCNYNQDGVRLAVFVGTYPGDLLTPSNWKKYNLDSDLDKTAWDGEFVSSAIQADGTIGLVYLYRPVSSGVTTLNFRTITLKQ